MSSNLIGSLRRRVDREIKAHLRNNSAIRRARYSFFQRVVRVLITGRSLPTFLLAYLLLDLVLIGAEVIFNLRFPQALPGWTTPEIKSLLKDIASYLIAAQVGIFGIVSVAVGIVTLITQRDDRSSTNTDIRLYYMESLAYEVVISGAAFLIVLCAQLVWPVQFLAHLAHLGGTDLVFKVVLTAFHLAWLLLNLAIFALFMLTTLHFVEPSARGRLRERYTANIIVPSDLRQRLLRVFYANAPKELVREAGEEAGLLLTFGHRMLTEGDIELSTKFATPSVLHDVWLHPLGFVLRGWWHRSERTLPKPRRQSALRGRDVWLSLEPSFDDQCEGEVTWCRRRGGVAFRSWERWAIRHSFRFRANKYGRDRLPTPSDFLEELADRVIAQIDRNAITGFKGAFDEFTRFHVFLLDAHNAQTEQGQPISFAEVRDLWDAPYQEWIRQYRRVFESAADKIGVETTFIETLGYTAMRLLPRDATELSPPVVTSLLDLSVHEVIVLEAWVTRRTSLDMPADRIAEPRLQLAGSERRAYESVVRNFIGVWESVLRVADSIYGFGSREDRSPAELWKAFGRSMPFLDKHLRNTAYLLASAIWNEDEIGAEHYRDCLLRWLNTLRLGVEADILLEHHALLTPDLLTLDWAAVEMRLQAHRRHEWPELPPPEMVFAIILHGVFDDVLFITAVLALAWNVKGQLPSKIGARAASLLQQRQAIEEGSHFASGNVRPPTAFRTFFSLLVRAALDEQFGKGGYGASLDSLVKDLNGMSEQPMVPGRIYTSWGWRGLDEVRLQVLVMLAISLPTEGDDGVGQWVRAFAANDTLFAGGDASLRRIDLGLKAYAHALGERLDQDLFERGVHALAPDAEVTAARTRLQAIFADAIAVIQEQRTKRLRALLIDPEKWDALTESVSSALNPEMYGFRGFLVERVQEQAPTATEWRMKGIDKANFVTPSMAWESSSDLNHLIAEAFQNYLTRRVWLSFFQRPREALQVDCSNEGFWDALAQNAQRVGSPATLLTTYDPFGAILLRWTHSPPARRPVGHHIEYVQGHLSGNGIGYAGTIDGVEVLTADVEEGHSHLFSTLMLEAVSYRLVTPDAFVSVEFEEGDDPWNGEVVVRFAQHAAWNDTPIIDLVTKDVPPDEEMPTAVRE